MYILLNQYHHEAKDAVGDCIPSERASANSASIVSSVNLSFELKQTFVSLRKLLVMVSIYNCWLYS
jgi:hypothetical protein